MNAGGSPPPRDASRIAWLLRSAQADPLLVVLLFAAILLVFAHPESPESYARTIDWPTLEALAGLLVLTRGIEHCGALQALARKLLARVRTVRQLALLLVTLAAALSTVLTNDVSLFLVVPLTLGIARISEVPLNRLVIFEALAVNAGSALTPIGNPQNLLLWHRAGGSMLSYARNMLPGVALMSLLLLAATVALFANRPIVLNQARASGAVNRLLLAVAAALLLLFLGLLELHRALPGLLLIAGVFVVAFRDVLRAVDWRLLLIIGLMFVNLGALARLQFLQTMMQGLALDHATQVYWTGLLLSQFISNVPAAIWLVPHTQLTTALALGVNLGGFGLAIGSLANLIALRQVGGMAIYREFHLISVPFLMLAAVVVWWALIH